MLDSLVDGGSLRRVPKSMGALGKARVIPKNSEKCSFIMNCMKQNASDCRPPPKFVLPQLEALRDCFVLLARPATSSTAPAHQLLGSGNAETTPARAPAAAADRKLRPDATCEGKNG